MAIEPLVMERTFNSPVGRGWEAITNEDQMRQCFDLQEFRLELGFAFQFEGENEGRRILHLCKVIDVVPGKQLRHRGYEGSKVDPDYRYIAEKFRRKGKSAAGITN